MMKQAAGPFHTFLCVFVCFQIIFKVLGNYQKVIAQWPSILSLVFLLGRFIYILVKDVRIRLNLEAEVSVWRGRTPALFGYVCSLVRICCRRPRSWRRGTSCNMFGTCWGKNRHAGRMLLTAPLPTDELFHFAFRSVRTPRPTEAALRLTLTAAGITFRMETGHVCAWFLPVLQEASQLVPETSLWMGSQLQIPKQDHWNCHNLPYRPVYSTIPCLKPLTMNRIVHTRHVETTSTGGALSVSTLCSSPWLITPSAMWPLIKWSVTRTRWNIWLPPATKPKLLEPWYRIWKNSSTWLRVSASVSPSQKCRDKGKL